MDPPRQCRAPAGAQPLDGLFDEAWYRNAYFPGREVPSGYRDAYDHYSGEGAAAGLSPGPYFDETWYRSAYPDAGGAIAAGACASGYEHYVTEGASRGYAPNRYFMPQWYLAWYTDARAAVERGDYAHAFEHYLREGLDLQLSPNPFFDERWYRETYADVDAAVRVGQILSGHQHYIESGAREGRQGSPVFEPVWYLNRYPDARKDIENGLACDAYDHLCRYGFAAGKSSCPDFDEGWYRKTYPDVRAGIAQGHWISGLHHFVAEGMQHGLAPTPSGAGSDPLGYNAATSVIGRRELREFLSGADELDLRCPGEPVVSIVVVLHNRAALTLRCLRSIAAWVRDPLEVIAVDNASRDETAEVLERVRGVRVLGNDCNRHFLRGANQGAAAAIGKYLLFLNNDCELQAGAVRSAVEILETEPDAGAVGAKQIRPDGRLVEAGCFLKPNAVAVQFGHGQEPFADEFMHRRDVPFCAGAFLMTPRRLFEETGGFDPAFEPAYCEDVDYCLRLWQKGRRVIFNPESIVLHSECGSAAYRRFLFAAVLRNFATLHKRYREYFETAPDYGIAPVSSLDGKRRRSACLLVVAEVEAERPAWAGVLDRLLAERRFVTIYPLRAWRGEREALAWLPAEVELASGKGREELETFCRQRAPVYQEAILLGDVRSPGEWLTSARTIADGPDMIRETQI